MDQSLYWVPYRINDPDCPYIVVGPFSNAQYAHFACDSMRRAAAPHEYVGNLIIAATEQEALALAPSCCGSAPVM